MRLLIILTNIKQLEELTINEECPMKPPFFTSAVCCFAHFPPLCLTEYFVSWQIAHVDCVVRLLLLHLYVVELIWYPILRQI